MATKVDHDMLKKKRLSTGELISSVTFFCFGVWLISEGLQAYYPGNYFKACLIVIGGTFSVLGAFRFQIELIIKKIRAQ